MNPNFDYHYGFRKYCTTTYEKLADWFRIFLKSILYQYNIVSQDILLMKENTKNGGKGIKAAH